MKIHCNGYSLNADKFSEEVREAIKAHLPSCRTRFLKENKDNMGRSGIYYADYRFYGDDRVISRIESATHESNFLKHPDAWIMEALRDCAESDHWYTFEKEW